MIEINKQKINKQKKSCNTCKHSKKVKYLSISDMKIYNFECTKGEDTRYKDENCYEER